MASVTSAGSAAIRRVRPAQWLWLRRYAMLGFVAAFGLWEAGVRVFKVAPYLLPPPSKIVVELSSRWPRRAGRRAGSPPRRSWPAICWRSWSASRWRS